MTQSHLFDDRQTDQLDFTIKIVSPRLESYFVCNSKGIRHVSWLLLSDHRKNTFSRAQYDNWPYWFQNIVCGFVCFHLLAGKIRLQSLIPLQRHVNRVFPCYCKFSIPQMNAELTKSQYNEPFQHNESN